MRTTKLRGLLDEDLFVTSSRFSASWICCWRLSGVNLRAAQLAERGFFAANHFLHLLQPLELGQFAIGFFTVLGSAVEQEQLIMRLCILRTKAQHVLKCLDGFICLLASGIGAREVKERINVIGVNRRSLLQLRLCPCRVSLFKQDKPQTVEGFHVLRIGLNLLQKMSSGLIKRSLHPVAVAD